MMSVIQRVKKRAWRSKPYSGQIDQASLALVCAERGDTEAEADKLLAKMLKLRIFSDEAGKMNKSLQDIGGGLLVVSQFTLAADTRGGNRPSFTAPPRRRRPTPLRILCGPGQACHAQVQTGEFAADMQVHLVNDGPVTIPMRMEPQA